MPNTPWDERSLKEQKRVQNVLLRQTVLQMALGHVPYVRARLAALGMDARVFKGLEELYRLPLSMRRDIVDPKRNPEGTRGVILRGTAEGVKRFSDRQTLRRVARARLLGGEEMHELAIEGATRAIHMHLSPGPGGPIPVAYTRDDLDLLARAGGRLAQLLGLAREDRLLNLVPFGPTLEFWGLFYMAHGLGMTALHVGRQDVEIAKSLPAFDEVRATAIAVAADDAVRLPELASEAGIDLTGLRTLIAVGRSLSQDERSRVGEGLLAAGATDARIAAAYGPPEGRVLWGECAVPAGRTETFGFHAFPDLDLLEIISPETGAPLAEQVAGEIVVTPLGFRGGGVPRWRTGDLALGGMTNEQCPNCGRMVPRVGPTVVRGAWQHVVGLNGKRVWVDLRDAGASAGERSPLWQIELRTIEAAAGDAANELFVYLSGPDNAGSIIDLYEDLGRVRLTPTQIVLASEEDLGRRLAEAPGPWPRYLERTSGA